MNITSGDMVAIDLAGARVTLPAAAIAQLWLEKIKGGAPAMEASLPAIGASGEHGVFAGIARGYDGASDEALWVVGEAGAPMSWSEAVKWAEGQGGRLPTLKESALLFANVPELFEAAWYWTGAQYAGNDDYAWAQVFSDGDLYDGHKGSKFRARAVRRVPFR